MKNSLFLFGICLVHVIGISAQIRMVDETYKEQMSASNYVKEPLAIDNILKPYDGMSIHGFADVNIVGDTLFTKGFSTSNGILVNRGERKMKVHLSSRGLEIPKGYWRVTGLYLCKDAGSSDIADEIFAMKDKGYEYIPGWSGDEISKEYLMSNLSSNFYGRDCWTLPQIKENIQRRKLNGDTGPWTMGRMDGNRLYCDAVHRLESIDSAYVCYLAISNETNNFLPVSYYNLLCNELKGQEVFMSYGGARPVIPNYMPYKAKELKDALNGITVFQSDTLFTCVDVVVNEELRTVCILEGKNTGRFAVFVNALQESNHEKDCQHVYYTPSGEMTIWPYKDHQENKGHLVRDRRFAVGEINREDRIIIKMTDLNDIYGETAIYFDKKETQRQYEQERYQARMAKRKQELCNRYGNEYGMLIADRKVALGMNPEMCKIAWGYPTMISNLVDNTGTYTVWKYNFKTYIYFKDGKVAMILN